MLGGESTGHRIKSRAYPRVWLMCMYVCMHESICDAPLLQQSRARARRPNRKDVSLACHSKVSMSMLDHEVTVAESSTILEHKQ